MNPQSIQSLDLHSFSCAFTSEDDLNKVLTGSPWTVRGAHLILKRWLPDRNFDEIDFTTTEFWVQAHNIPLDRMTAENAKKMGTFVAPSLKWMIDGCMVLALANMSASGSVSMSINLC